MLRLGLSFAPGLVSQFDDDPRMVAGLLPAARTAINLRRDEPRLGLVVKQDVIDPQTRIALERIAPIFPEGVDALVGVKMSPRSRWWISRWGISTH